MKILFERKMVFLMTETIRCCGTDRYKGIQIRKFRKGFYGKYKYDVKEGNKYF